MLAQHLLFIWSFPRSKRRSLLIQQKMRSYMHLVCWERFLRCFDKFSFWGWFVFEGQVSEMTRHEFLWLHFLHLNKGSSDNRGWGQSWNMSYFGPGASQWNCKGSVSSHKDLWTDCAANRIVAWTWDSCQLNVLLKLRCLFLEKYTCQALGRPCVATKERKECKKLIWDGGWGRWCFDVFS